MPLLSHINYYENPVLDGGYYLILGCSEATSGTGLSNKNV